MQQTCIMHHAPSSLEPAIAANYSTVLYVCRDINEPVIFTEQYSCVQVQTTHRRERAYQTAINQESTALMHTGHSGDTPEVETADACRDPYQDKQRVSRTWYRVLSRLTGCEGLNLQAYSDVYFATPHWNQ